MSDYPLHLINLHLRRGHPLACRHCWRSMLPTRQRGDSLLPARAAIQALHAALPLGLRAARLSGSRTPGGDALQHPEIEALLDRLESLELQVEVETSGAGLTPARAARLAALPQCDVVIGLDGASAAVHDAFNGAGTFDLAVAAARQLARHGLGARLVFSVQRASLNQIPEAIRLAEALSARSLRLVPAHYGMPVRLNGAIAHIHGPTGPLRDCERAGRAPVNTGRLGTAPFYTGRLGTAPLMARRTTGGLAGSGLRVEELIALGRRVERELARATSLPLIFDQPPAFRGLNSFRSARDASQCAVLSSISVLPGGWYALCGGTAPDQALGRVGMDALATIWREHPTLMLLRDSLPDRLEGICERCLMKSACLGYCPVENFHKAGRFWSPYWFCQAAERAGLFPASRLVENSW